jgi:hypothetical protein
MLCSVCEVVHHFVEKTAAASPAGATERRLSGTILTSRSEREEKKCVQKKYLRVVR